LDAGFPAAIRSCDKRLWHVIMHRQFLSQSHKAFDMNMSTESSPLLAASKCVLIVDDDAFSQELLSGSLMELGFENIFSADNGRTALRTLSTMARAPDYLVCDIYMPDMDGLEFLAELAKLHFQGGVLLVSGEDISMMAIAQQVAIEDGLKLLGAFVKPVPFAVLAQAFASMDTVF
jgi:CheY-like chemotaxis protein